jgi:hypothetical protein
MIVELLYFYGCPHADASRELLHRCLAQAGVTATVADIEGECASPSVRIDGIDVMGEPITSGRACRLDRPTEERVLAALAGKAVHCETI